MTWTARILAILNLIAAGVLFYAAGRAAYQRSAWNHYLDDQRKYRDGLSTENWLQGVNATDLAKVLDNMEVTPLLLERLPENVRATVERLERQKKSQVQNLEARGEKPPHRARTEAEQRQALAGLTVDQKTLDENPGRLLLDAEGLKELREKLGPGGFARLVRQAIILNQPKLQAEELRLADQKASLLRRKEIYQADIEAFTEEIARLEGRLKDERDLKEKLDTENRARINEITQLYAEVEEALHARDVALGRELDMRRQLAEVQARIVKNQDKAEQLRQAIEAKETVTKKD